MILASTVVEIRVVKGSYIAFQYTRSLTDQPRPSKLSNCLCLNRSNITSKYDFGINSVTSRVFKGSNKAFQCMRSLTYQPSLRSLAIVFVSIG